MAFYLALKEVWRNRGRFFLFSLVIALITTLVLFIAALIRRSGDSQQTISGKAGCSIVGISKKCRSLSQYQPDRLD